MNALNVETARLVLRRYADPKKAAFLQGYFKTEKGGYGEGDQFLGLKVPDTRRVARQFRDLALKECVSLLQSKIHEERLLALLVLVLKFEKAENIERKKIFECYLKNLRFINNWDLIDTSAPNIVGGHLFDQNRAVLYRLAKSENLWEKRVAILSTYYFIRKNEYADTLKLAEILLGDEHDLIHKAVGWMLREVGNRDLKHEEKFLKIHYKKMPRTMLRYAIEKFPEGLRKKYLRGEVR